MPQPVTMWTGACMRPQPDGEPHAIHVPSHAEAAVYIRNWAPNTPVATAENVDNAWIQLPVKMSEVAGMRVFYIYDLINALTHYLNFLTNQKIEVYKVTATGYNTVQIDKRPNSPHGGEIQDVPLAPTYYLPNSNYIGVKYSDIPQTAEYTITTMHRHRDYKIRLRYLIARTRCTTSRSTPYSRCTRRPTSTRSSQALTLTGSRSIPSACISWTIWRTWTTTTATTG